MTISNLATLEMAEVFAAENRSNLAITVEVDSELQRVFIVFGDLTRVRVPFSFFTPSGDGTTPDFTQPFVADHGQTIGFGKYEAAVDAVLAAYPAE